jgi:cyclopropane fatty-acyl-phospholipid synthase-like methyltransferase
MRALLQRREVGAGCRLLKLHARKYAVTGVDLSGEMLDILHRKNSAVKLVKSDIDAYIGSMGSDESYDIICFSAVLHHLPDYFDTLEKISGHLKSGGILYIVHEPSLRSSDTMGLQTKLMHMIDWKYFLLTLKFSGISLPDVDYSFSDYHVFQGGVDSSGICRQLQKQGLVIEANDLYWARKSSVLAFVDDRILKTPSSAYFRILARKKAPLAPAGRLVKS